MSRALSLNPELPGVRRWLCAFHLRVSLIVAPRPLSLGWGLPGATPWGVQCRSRPVRRATPRQLAKITGRLLSVRLPRKMDWHCADRFTCQPQPPGRRRLLQCAAPGCAAPTWEGPSRSRSSSFCVCLFVCLLVCLFVCLLYGLHADPVPPRL